jgi:hypothetical protein
MCKSSSKEDFIGLRQKKNFEIYINFRYEEHDEYRGEENPPPQIPPWPHLEAGVFGHNKSRYRGGGVNFPGAL